MGNLISQMLLCLLTSALLGGLVGWFLRSLFQAPVRAAVAGGGYAPIPATVERPPTGPSVDNLRNELNDFRAKLNESQKAVADRDARIAALEKDLASARATIDTFPSERDRLNARIKTLEDAAAVPAAPSVVEATDEFTATEATDEMPVVSGRTDLERIEGIGSVSAATLREQGIRTVDDLLKAGATPAGRADIVAKTGIVHDAILRWVNMADLFRIRGVDEEYSNLLEASGVDSVVELAKRNAASLVEKMTAANNEHHLVRRLPTSDQAKDWIAQAKSLPRVVTY